MAFLYPIDWADVTALYADAANVDALIQVMILEYVNDEVDEDKFATEGRVQLARTYLAAHFAAFAQPSVNGALGTPKRDIVGDVEVEYNGFSISDAAGALERTSYGQNYLYLAKTPKSRGPFGLF